MQYLGGKSRAGQDIAGIINVYRKPGQAYWEPFVGSGWVAQHVNKIGPNYLSDLRSELIALWLELQKGWIPPSVVSKGMYDQARLGKLPPHLTAFIGYGCSYSGKWFGGYARNDRANNYAVQAKNSLLGKISRIGLHAHFYEADFLAAGPPDSQCLIYCDPPYANTAAYDGLPAFDHARFWEKVKALTAQGHTVLVSEYQAPSDAIKIWEQGTKTDLHTGGERNGGSSRIERLFTYNDLPVLKPSLFDLSELEAI